MASPSSPDRQRDRRGVCPATTAPRGSGAGRGAPCGGEWSRRARVGQLLAAWSMVCLLTMCGSESVTTGGSETHFLQLCDADCPGELECVCGACTAPCDQAADCAGWADAANCVPSAVRVLTQRCPGTTAPAFCDRSCLLDVDCAALGEEHRCESGYCRRSDGDTAPPLSGGEDCAPAPLAADELVVLLRCENASPVGWQMNVPRLTLTDAAGGELVLEPTAPLVPRDGVTWVSLHAPLAGGGGWSAS